jgi:hypothetical protein
MIAKANCLNCGNGIEFDPVQFGNEKFFVVNCPHCGKETVLTVRKDESPKVVYVQSPPKKSKLMRLALKALLIFIAFFIVVVAIDLIVPGGNSSSENHPAKYSGVYVLSFGDAPSLSVDLRSDGSGLFCGLASTWFLDGETIKLQTQMADGRTTETRGYKAEGNDLIDGNGNRWIRIH